MACFGDILKDEASDILKDKASDILRDYWLLTFHGWGKVDIPFHLT